MEENILLIVALVISLENPSLSSLLLLFLSEYKKVENRSSWFASTSSSLPYDSVYIKLLIQGKNSKFEINSFLHYLTHLFPLAAIRQVATKNAWQCSFSEFAHYFVSLSLRRINREVLSARIPLESQSLSSFIWSIRLGIAETTLKCILINKSSNVPSSSIFSGLFFSALNNRLVIQNHTVNSFFGNLGE